MTYLELCQEFARQAAISGPIVSVIDASGEALRAVGWVAKAWRYVQNVHSDWTFLRRDAGFNTVAAKSNYTANDGAVLEFGEWLFAQEWRCYTTSLGVADEQPVRFMPYDHFRQVYLYGNNRTATGRPQVVTEKPDQSLQFWPIPDAIYTIVGEQYRAPQTMVGNADVPIIPAKFHDIIVERALMLYGSYEGDATVFAAAQNEYARILGEMELLYLPDWEEPGTMA